MKEAMKPYQKAMALKSMDMVDVEEPTTPSHANVAAGISVEIKDPFFVSRRNVETSKREQVARGAKRNTIRRLNTKPREQEKKSEDAATAQDVNEQRKTTSQFSRSKNRSISVKAPSSSHYTADEQTLDDEQIARLKRSGSLAKASGETSVQTSLDDSASDNARGNWKIRFHEKSGE